jgi:ATP phosphoribosyltransferase
VLHFIAFKTCEMDGAIELAIEAGISGMVVPWSVVVLAS